MNKEYRKNVSKRSIAENIDLNENKIKNSNDENCMRKLNNLFETFESNGECGSENNIPKV